MGYMWLVIELDWDTMPLCQKYYESEWANHTNACVPITHQTKAAYNAKKIQHAYYYIHDTVVQMSVHKMTTYSRCRDGIPSRIDALTVVNLVPDKSLKSTAKSHENVYKTKM